MLVKKRLSVAAAMTVMTLMLSAFLMVWVTTPNLSLWPRANYLVMLFLYGIGTGAAWRATGRGSEPSLIAPMLASVQVFIGALAFLLVSVGVKLSESAPVTNTVPQPASNVMMIILLISAVYVVGMGFWLRAKDK